MVLVIGGCSQGKRAFVRARYGLGDSLTGKPMEGGAAVCGLADGAQAPWEAFLKAGCAWNLHLMIRRRLEAGEAAEKLEKELPEQLLRACPERILITDEIGYGIVPLDPFERAYREAVGRICCVLAAEAQEVWRVVAGIGMRIK